MAKFGYLEKGVWVEGVFHTRDSQGNFLREETAFRSKISKDGSTAFPAVSGRYHLIVAYVCPWAHRTVITRRLKKLEDVISIVITTFGSQGAEFDAGEGSESDALYGFKHLHQYYTKADPNFTGRVTVPVLWDKETETIVNNESAEIAEMLNGAYVNDIDLSPLELKSEMDELNAIIQDRINNGAYKCGFAGSQAAYEGACTQLFETLDLIEERLSTRRYLYGSRLTLGDVRLYTTLVRFDSIYFILFKCSKRPISSYPNLFNYLKDLYQIPGIGDTVDIQIVKNSYFQKMLNLNPLGLVPLGPILDLTAPHGRETLA